MTHSLSLRLQQNAQRFPEKPVFIYPGRKTAWETVTYREFVVRVDLLARGLAAFGLCPGMRAALMVPPSVDMFALVFALLQSGVVPVMVDPAIGLRNVTPCLAECRPEAYIGSFLSHAIRRLFGWGGASLRWNFTLADLARAGAAAPPVPPTAIDPQAEAAIVYTSGSTGLPKGAVYTGANFLGQIEMLVNALQLHCDEIDLPAFPMFAMIDCLLGVTAVIPDMRFPPPAKIDPLRVAAAIQTHRVNTLFVSPAALARLARYGAGKGLRLDSLQKVITAGAPAPAEVLAQFAGLLSPEAQLFGVYGATEALPVTMVSSQEILQETRHRTALGAGVCIGKPLQGAEVQVIPISDEALTPAQAQPLPAGAIGEITVRGPVVTEKYVARQAANRLAKITMADGIIAHRMGDLGYFDAQGRVWYCGRKSQRVVTEAGTLFTEPVEGIFNAHPLVHRTALVGVKKDGHTQPVLWVELTAAARRADKNQLRAELLALAETYPAASAIQTILFHPAFPTDVRHNSKIIREKLAEQAKGLI